MEPKKQLIINLKFEKVDEVLKDVEDFQEEVEVNIRIASDNIKQLLGNDNIDEKLKKLIDRISNLDWDSIIDNPRIQKPPISIPSFENFT